MWVYPKHPCTQSFRSHGLAVGRVERYPLKRKWLLGGLSEQRLKRRA